MLIYEFELYSSFTLPVDASTSPLCRPSPVPRSLTIVSTSTTPSPSPLSIPHLPSFTTPPPPPL